MQGTMLGAPSPLKRSCWTSVRPLMVHAACGSRTERTRVFQNVVQEVPVKPGTTTRLRVQHKTEHIRVEFQQRRSDFKIQVTYMYNGVPRLTHTAPGRMGSHVWEMLEVVSEVPFNANEARIELISSLSGTAWFDGIIFEVIEGLPVPVTDRLTIPAHRTDVEMTQIVLAQPRQQPRNRLRWPDGRVDRRVRCRVRSTIRTQGCRQAASMDEAPLCPAGTTRDGGNPKSSRQSGLGAVRWRSACG